MELFLHTLVHMTRLLEEYFILEEPSLMYSDSNRPKHYTDQHLMLLNRKYYRFEEYGIWVFFDMQGHLKTLRFETPFRGTVGGVKVGDSKEYVLSVKGSPESDDSNVWI